MYTVAVSIANVHAQPDADSELVTQALLNTPAIANSTIGMWTAVTLPDYEGWVRSDELEEPIVKGFCKVSACCATPLELFAVVMVPCAPLYAEAVGEERLENNLDSVYLSTLLPLLDTTHAQRLQVALPGEQTAWLSRRNAAIRERRHVYARAPISAVIAYARQFLGVPYLWGGRSYRGIDCSGLVELCYRMAGYALPRDTRQQHSMLRCTVALEEMQEGDLIFFGEERIIHVAVALNKNEYIHAEGINYNCVTINSLASNSPNYDRRLAEIVHSIKRAE